MPGKGTPRLASVGLVDGSPNQGVTVLAREGEYWTVVFAGRVSRVRDAKGLHYLDHLVRHPGQAVPRPRADRRGGSQPARAVAAACLGRTSLITGSLGDAGQVLDASAVAAYRRRFLDLREELEDAEACADEAWRAGPRTRWTPSPSSWPVAWGWVAGTGGPAPPSERSWLAVTKAIRSAMRRLDEGDHDLGQHLERTMRTGTFCAYVPIRRSGSRWTSRSTPADAGDESTTPPSAAPASGALRGPSSRARAGR